MIRPIDIKLNAAHPELPLVEATTFTGAPSSVFIRGVPKSCGNWSITAINVAVTYPDNSTTTRAAVESAEGVWVATIPGTATSGRTAAGFKIMADGIDENGAAVTGYVLGFADFSVLSFTPVPAPGGTFYLLRYFDQAPATPKKGDVAVVDGLMKMYNGTAWAGFGDGPGFSETDPLMDGSASPGTATTAARSDHVHPSDTSRASTADATLTNANTWTFEPATYNGYPIEMREVEKYPSTSPGVYFFIPYARGSEIGAAYYDTTGYATSLSLQWNGPEGDNPSSAIPLTATRTALQGYQLGSQSDKPVASEAEAEALRTGKADKPATFTEGNLAKFDNNGNPTDSGKKPSDFATAAQGAKADAALSRVEAEAGFTEWQFSDGASHEFTGPEKPFTLWRYFLDGVASNESFESQAQALAATNLTFDRLGAKIAATRTRLPTMADVDTRAFRAANPTAGNLAALDANGNPTDSLIPAANVATKGAIPYALVTKTISNNAVTLDDRASNAVSISATLSPNTLTINFPTAPSGKVRDFAMRLNIAAGVTAPEIAWPQGVTLENNGGEVPEIADGGTGGSSTILYFSETENNGTTAKFLVKGETLTAIAQA